MARQRKRDQEPPSTPLQVDRDFIVKVCRSLEGRVSWAVTDWQKEQGGQCCVAFAGTVLLSYAVQLWRQHLRDEDVPKVVAALTSKAIGDPESVFDDMMRLAMADFMPRPDPPQPANAPSNPPDQGPRVLGPGDA